MFKNPKWLTYTFNFEINLLNIATNKEIRVKIISVYNKSTPAFGLSAHHAWFHCDCRGSAHGRHRKLYETTEKVYSTSLNSQIEIIVLCGPMKLMFFFCTRARLMKDKLDYKRQQQKNKKQKPKNAKIYQACYSNSYVSFYIRLNPSVTKSLTKMLKMTNFMKIIYD